MAVLGLRFCARAFSSCGKRGPLFIAVRGPLTIGPLLLRSTGSRRAGSVIVAHRPSCPAACGTFPDQGSNPCPLHWQADSQPLRHQGSPGHPFGAWICFVVSRGFPLKRDEENPATCFPVLRHLWDTVRAFKHFILKYLFWQPVYNFH